ncbi:MAG: tetratricopeptide repeat protein [Nocardiaceae bacterium]|nr:tetratricopeptide repeat protein [Nocardiaceae bacterium]
MNRASCLVNAGRLARLRGNYRMAERLLRSAIAAAKPHSESDVCSRNELAILFKYTGRFAEAEALYRQALAILETANGDPLSAAAIYHNLGGLAHARKDYVGAEEPARRAVEIRLRTLGPRHIDTAADQAALAAILDGLGRVDEAEQLLRTALETFEQRVNDYEVAVTLGNLAVIVQRRGDLLAAESMQRRALAIRESMQGPTHPELAVPLSNLAVTLTRQGRHDEAVPLLRRALALAKVAIEPTHPNLAILRNNVAKAEAAAV